MTDEKRLDIDDTERFWKGQLAQVKRRKRDGYLLITPQEALDVLRVIAHVRALEAQVALDAKALDAERALFQMGAPKMYDSVFNRTMCALCGGEVEDDTGWVRHRDDCLWMLAADALAARDAGKEVTE